MRQYQGLPASSGIAIGPAWIYNPVKVTVKVESIKDPEAEWLRLMSAVNLARNQVQALEERARVNIGQNEAAIFEAHLEFLEDVDIMGKIRNIIFKQSLNAECAVETVFNEFAKELSELPDPYLAARAQDLQDVAHRLIRCLVGADDNLGDSMLVHPSVIVADDLTPSDTVQFDKRKILGICTSKGGPTSHTAILARSLGVPAMVSGAFDIMDVENGILTILDGSEGLTIFGPTINELNMAKEKRATWESERNEQVASAHQSALTVDGHAVEVVANIGGIDDARKAVELGAEGVGLFRTEFLYLDRNELLEISEQTSIYRGVVDILAGRPLVVRTLDIGGDKSVPYLSLVTEANPFLGWRGIRMVRERPDILANQFEALLLAGVGADLRIMLPMVSSVGEVVRAREILEEVRASLKAQGKAIAEKVQFGIMVEVPSAALLAEHFAPYIDFYSIGTNDLTQYSLAVDRTNERVAVLASPFNPAVLKLVAMTIEAAHRHGKWVGMCGELAGEPSAVPLLLGMGLDEFSMASASVPAVKQVIRKWSLERCKEVAKEALALPGSSEVIKYLKGLTPS
jgi:phosphoenolpyruvate-protein phosphotransferase